MTVLRYLLIVFSCLVLAAHFFRSELIELAGLSLILPVLLAARRRWARLTLRVALALATLEWLRTLYVLVAARMAFGLPWARMALILACVAALTAAASWLAAPPSGPAAGSGEGKGRG